MGETDLLLSGSYSIEEKITVEWERQVTIDELAALVRRLPDRLYSKRELRSFVSGFLRDSDDSLPDTKISNYRISSRSMQSLIATLEERGVLEASDSENGQARWIPKVRR